MNLSKFVKLECKNAHDLMKEPPPEWLVRDLILANGVSVLIGESGTGKTFVALDMAISIANKDAWYGYDVKRGSVAYFSWEGDAFGLRLQAIQQKGDNLDNFYFFRASLPLSPILHKDNRAEERSQGQIWVESQLTVLKEYLEAKELPPITAVFIDTVRASLSGSEDSSENVAAYIRATRQILETVPGAAIIMVHHTGWQDGEFKKKRERGSSTFRGNVESSLYLERTEAIESRTYLRLRPLKVRDAELTGGLALVRSKVELGKDDRGNPISSCFIHEDRRTMEERFEDVQEAEKSRAKAIMYEVLKAIKENPDNSGVRELRKVVKKSMSEVSEVLKELEANGLVAKSAVGGGNGLKARKVLTKEGEGFVREYEVTQLVG